MAEIIEWLLIWFVRLNAMSNFIDDNFHLTFLGLSKNEYARNVFT